MNKEYDKIKGIETYVGGYFDGYYNVKVDFSSGKYEWSHSSSYKEEQGKLDSREIEKLKSGIEELDLLNWQREYVDPYILDGIQWEVQLIRDARNIKKYGSNEFPEKWEAYRHLIEGVIGKQFG